jgi:hypothetical protein
MHGASDHHRCRKRYEYNTPNNRAASYDVAPHMPATNQAKARRHGSYQAANEQSREGTVAYHSQHAVAKPRARTKVTVKEHVAAKKQQRACHPSKTSQPIRRFILH